MSDEWETLWQEGREAQQERGDGVLPKLPGGSYQARVAVARINVTSWGEEQFSVYWIAPHPDGGDGGVWANLTLDAGNPNGLRFTAGQVHMLGFDGDTLDELRRWAEAGSALDRVHDIRVKVTPGEKRDFIDVYVNRYHRQWEGVEKALAGGYPPVNDDDDIPF